ncbi:MAG: Zn-dependent hydrolase [Verrucomicrobia bacterium]|nr:Zn-dependent hydrolase [Verrucomicrobiota bacterium]
MKNLFCFALVLGSLVASGCQGLRKPAARIDGPDEESARKVRQYARFRLTTDLTKLSDRQKSMLPFLIEAARIMDELFWIEAYGDKEALLGSVRDPATGRFVEMNYGPWDRLDGNRSFVAGIGEKPKGANFYPADMTVEEFEGADLADKASPYTLLRRDDQGRLKTIPYHQAFAVQVERAAGLLRQAAMLAEDPGLRRYLMLRAEALLTDQYRESDLAWLDMKDNILDVVIGPIENYEDALFGYKSAHEAYVLVKDREWSQRLSKYAALLGDLQKGLPVSEAYKRETPGSNADLNAYDVVYYAGDCNSGSKTIAINLPNDESVQLEKGTRRLQLKNAMRAKFEKILVPIADVLIAADQRDRVTFDAFFSNIMFHEVAHGLGIKNTIDGKGTVREALKEHAAALEEGKADILGLYMIGQLHDTGVLEGDLEDAYVTFMAGIFRSIRFGASSAHGRANMIRFNYFLEHEAFSRDAATGTYRVRFERMREAIASLSRLILTLQGDGDYEGVGRLVTERGNIGAELQSDLRGLSEAGIPVDIVFEQGTAVLGL